MTNEELRRHNEGRRIHQIAWVTRDLEKSLKAWVEDLKVGPWRVYRFTDKTVKNLHVGGEPVTEPFEFRIAISRIGDMEVELIQPVHGPTIYEKHLAEKGEGLHHIKEKIADADMAGVVADYSGRGIRVTQTGQFFADFHFYLDTEPRLDFVYELGNCPVQDLPRDAFAVYPPEAPT
jgi:methylmalonyl-CoA/ethylmalonyl-CoA epimerase